MTLDQRKWTLRHGRTTRVLAARSLTLHPPSMCLFGLFMHAALNPPTVLVAAVLETLRSQQTGRAVFLLGPIQKTLSSGVVLALALPLKRFSHWTEINVCFGVVNER